VVRLGIPLHFTSHIDRCQCAPWGLYGGKDAMPNRIAIRRNGTLKDDFGNAKVYTMALQAGDAVMLRGGGGGGFGPPHERAPDSVREDVRQGYVSLEAARELYGVVLDPATLAVDEAATAALRAGAT
jgi:N-methylhydantoinase B